MRAPCQASKLNCVSDMLDSLSSFSHAQNVFDPTILEPDLQQLLVKSLVRPPFESGEGKPY